MKKLALVILPAFILLAASCEQQADVDAMLSNAESRNQIFTKIANDHEMTTEMLGNMMSNNHSKMMIQGNQEMMAMMMKDGNMIQLMKDNPNVMQNMMSGMIKDGKMMGNIVLMMNKEGLLSDEAMRSSTKMMSEKGINMDGMMNDKGTMKNKN